MISVEAALDHLFSLVDPLPPETVPLTGAVGRVLSEPVFATRDQPPFSASAMDGYAVPSGDARPGAVLKVIGEAAAGHRFSGQVTMGTAVRIFTGAPLPEGADRVIIQEDVERNGDRITLGETLDAGFHVRPAAADFAEGDRFAPDRRLTPEDVALLAAMNCAEVRVHRRSDVAILATGDELVPPGETPGPDQIVASNSYGLHALLTRQGARPRLLPIARDTVGALAQAFEFASGADLLLTIGGASVGDHDLVGAAAASAGLDRSFYKIAMRPGKPLMAGRLNGMAMIGLPGNPVSAMVCGHIFVLPVLRKLMGLGSAPAPRLRLPLAAPVRQNGPREHYMRAKRVDGGVQPFERQDSSLLSVLSEADCLLVRPPDDPPRSAGHLVDIVNLYGTD